MAKSKSKTTVEEIPVASDDKQRKKMLDLAIDKIQRDFGKGAIMKMGEQTNKDLKVIPTGALTLDLALGVGGVPRGRIIEVFGPEASGKTTMALSILAECQKQGGIAAFIDAEHAMDPSYAGKIGVNVDELLISQPDTGEQALEITEQLVRSGAVDIIVVDSVAALVPKAEIDGEMGDSHVGLQARLMSQALRKLTAVIGKTDTVLIFINQLRQKIGVIYGNPEVTTGGNALKFYSSVRLDIRRKEALKKGDEHYGNHVLVRVKKNKVAPPFKQAEFDIIFGEGISSESCLLDVATQMGIVKRMGAWYSYNDEKLGQGRDKVRDRLKEERDLYDELEKKVRDEIEAQRQGIEPAAAEPSKEADMPEVPDTAPAKEAVTV